MVETASNVKTVSARILTRDLSEGDLLVSFKGIMQYLAQPLKNQDSVQLRVGCSAAEARMYSKASRTFKLPQVPLRSPCDLAAVVSQVSFQGWGTTCLRRSYGHSSGHHLKLGLTRETKLQSFSIEVMSRGKTAFPGHP